MDTPITLHPTLTHDLPGVELPGSYRCQEMSPARDNEQAVLAIPNMGVRSAIVQNYCNHSFHPPPYLYEGEEDLPHRLHHASLGNEGLSPQTNAIPVSLPVAQAGSLASQPALTAALPASSQPTSTSCANITRVDALSTPNAVVWRAPYTTYKFGAAQPNPVAIPSMPSFTASLPHFPQPRHPMRLAQGDHPMPVPPPTAQAPGLSEHPVRAPAPHDSDPPPRPRHAQPIQLASAQQWEHVPQHHDEAQGQMTLQVSYSETGERSLVLTFESQDWPKVPFLAEVLGLTKDAHVDVYSSEPGRKPVWKAFEPETAVSVEPGQRVVMRMRQNPLVGMADGDSPGIQGDFLHQARERGMKRSALRPIPLPCNAKTRRTSDDADPDPMTDCDTSARNEANRKGKGGERRGRKKDRKRKRMDGRQRGSCGMNGIIIRAFKALCKTGDDGPRYPFDFAVCDYVEGGRELVNLQRQKIYQRKSFPIIFDGAKYVKSTVHKYRGMWQTAPEDLRQKFIAYGRTDEGIFANFITALREHKNKGEGLDILPEPEASNDLEEQWPADFLEGRVGRAQQGVRLMRVFQPLEEGPRVRVPFHANDDHPALNAALGLPLTFCEFPNGVKEPDRPTHTFFPSNIPLQGMTRVLGITWPGYGHLGFKREIILETTVGDLARQISHFFRDFYGLHHQDFMAPGIRLGPNFVTFDRLRLRAMFLNGKDWNLEIWYVYQDEPVYNFV